MTTEDKYIQDLRALEAILFAATEPLTTNALYERLGSDCDMGALLSELQTQYEKRGFQLINLDGNWAFRTAPDLGDFLAVEKEVQRKLSRAAMETLAIVAYHQPVTRAEIENIRGVATSKGTLDVLLEAGWVKPGRRRETPGRPLTWITTTAFMDQFGLETMTDLPGLDELKSSGLLDRRPAVDTLPDTRDLFGDDLEEDDSDDDENDIDENDNNDHQVEDKINEEEDETSNA